MTSFTSQEYKAYLSCFQRLSDSPVVQVITQPPIADAKFEVLQKLGVLKDVQRIKDVVTPAQEAVVAYSGRDEVQ